MGAGERKARERVERERRIMSAARMIAESEGWNAVTIRRLAQEIEYSQPVLCSHFENRDAIVAAVAVDGFQAFAAALGKAAHRSHDRSDAAQNVALAYLSFARQQPAVYAAMFTLPTSLRFAAADTLPELRDAFATLGAMVPPSSADTEAVTETFWAILHGLAELERSGRIREEARMERVLLAVDRLLQPR